MSDLEPQREDDTRCPVCGAPAQRGQLVCLECGSRVALAYRRPPSWKLPLAIAVAVGALAVAGAIVAYGAVRNDARDEVAAKPLSVKKSKAKSKTQAKTPAATTAKPAPGRAKTTPAKPATSPTTTPRAAAGGLVARGGIYAWPRDLAAYTVVLVSNGDRASALRFARSAAKGGNRDRIGVLRADDFKGLSKGFYLVFAGQYPSRSRAQAASARLGKRFKGAFPQRVSR